MAQTPLEREVLELREENSRLKALLELREDRSDLERFQVHSRNKLIVFMGTPFVLLLTVSWVYFLVIKSEDANALNQSRATIYKLKHGAIVIPEN